MRRAQAVAGPVLAATIVAALANSQPSHAQSSARESAPGILWPVHPKTDLI